MGKKNVLSEIALPKSTRKLLRSKGFTSFALGEGALPFKRKRAFYRALKRKNMNSLVYVEKLKMAMKRKPKTK